MSAVIYFLLGVLFTAACEWFYLKKYHDTDALHDTPKAAKESVDTMAETAASFTATASASATSASDKILDIPAVSKGRAFLERMATKEETQNHDKALKEVEPGVVPVRESNANKQDKTSIKTTRAMAKKTSNTTINNTQKKTAEVTDVVTGEGVGIQDDLQKVSGIGPKIEELLKAEEIHSFGVLAGTKVSALSQIMQKAGPRYALADVSSWPEQAKMLSHGDTEALEMLQQSLKKG